jgi:hypothetical protein
VVRQNLRLVTPWMPAARISRATRCRPTLSPLAADQLGGDPPVAVGLNWTADQTVPNQVTVKVASDGGISIFNDLGTVQVILDLAGFYS